MITNWKLKSLHVIRKQFSDYMPYPSQIVQRNIKEKLEERFLNILQDALNSSILNLPENKPLIKRERQMKMEPIYSPTCDVAIGPFSFREGSLNQVYNNLAKLDEIRILVDGLQRRSLGTGYNATLLDLNKNPRCFIAVEVENTTARDIKHLLGSIINCSFLGKIGIVVVFDEYLGYAQRLLQYLGFLKRVKKTKKELFRNVFVISKSTFVDLLEIE